jgi:PAS domain-containing protein
MAQASQSRRETEALRVALERAEKAEAELRETAERMEMANEAAGISMWEWDVKTNIVRVAAGSGFVKRIGGATSYVGTDYARDYVHPDDRQAYEQSFIDGLKAPRGGDDRIAHRYRLVLADGTVQHIQYHGRILRNLSGKPTGILGVDWEVTREEEAAREIARQAEQLREAQERFQRAISGTQDALI